MTCVFFYFDNEVWKIFVDSSINWWDIWNPKLFTTPETGALPSVLANVLQDGDLVLTQGAGDVGKVAKQLAAFELNIDKMSQDS